MQFLTFVSLSALRRVVAAATPLGEVVAVASLAELEARMRSQAESCVIVDPALLSVADADAFAKVAVELPKAVIAYTSLTPSAMQSVVILALRTGPQFVYQGTPDERSALVRALLAVPGPEFGGALIIALSPRLAYLTPPLREVVVAMLRTGSGSLHAVGLASRSGVPRRTMDRSVVSAGFKSTRVLIAAAKIVRSYRAITTTRTSFKRIGAALGYASQRTLDQQCQLVLGQSSATLRRTPLPIHEAVAILVSRIVRSAECPPTVGRCQPDTMKPRHRQERNATEQAPCHVPVERSNQAIAKHLVAS